MEGPDAQFTLQGAKRTLVRRQLHIVFPQHRRIFSPQSAAQQIVAIPLFGGLPLGLVHLKPERRAGDRLARLGKLNFHEPEGAARFLLGGPDRSSPRIRAEANSCALPAACAANAPAVCAAWPSPSLAVPGFWPARKVRPHAGTA